MSERIFSIDPERVYDLLGQAQTASGTLSTHHESVDELRQRLGAVKARFTLGAERSGAERELVRGTDGQLHEPPADLVKQRDALQLQLQRAQDRQSAAAAELVPVVTLGRRVLEFAKSKRMEVSSYGF